MSSDLTTALRLDDVDSIVVLPLAFGGVAPNRRKASWNGGKPYSLPFVEDDALQWVAARGHHTAPHPSWTPTFIRFGRHVTGCHDSATVAVLSQSGFEPAVDIATSMLSSDGARCSTGVGEWSPALVTIAGATTLGIHVVCLDEATEAELDRRLTERAGLTAWLRFNRLVHEDATAIVDGRTSSGPWNVLRKAGTGDAGINGLASRLTLTTANLHDESIITRLRAVVPHCPAVHPPQARHAPKPRHTHSRQ